MMQSAKSKKGRCHAICGCLSCTTTEAARLRRCVVGSGDDFTRHLGLHTAGKIGIMCRIDAIDNALRQPACFKGPAACCCCMASTHAHAE
jgi:hypothetical protein